MSGGARASQGELIASAADLVQAAQAALRDGHLRESRALFTEGAAAAIAQGERKALVDAALGVGGLWVFEQRDFLERAALEELWRGALAEVEPDSLAAARLRVRLAAEAVYAGGSVGRVEECVAEVARHGDAAACAEAFSFLHHVHLGPSFARSRLQLAEQIVSHAARAGEPVLGLMGLCWRTVDLYLLGDKGADQSLQELRERSQGCEAIAFIAEVMSAMRLARAGRLPDAEAVAEAACHRGIEAGDPDAPAYYGALIATLRWWQGRGSEVIEQVRDLATSPRLASNAHVYVAANAILSGALGDLDAAEEALAWLAEPGLARLPDTSSWLTTQFLAGEAAFVLGDVEVARQVSNLVRPYADLPVLPSLAVVCLGSAKRALGLAAATCGELDDAVTYLEGALDADQRLGSRPMAVLTEHALAHVLSARRADGDQARSDALSTRAALRARRFGVSLPAVPEWLARRAGRHHRCRMSQGPGGWRVDVDERSAVVADSVGMGYLAVLIAAPDEDHHVLMLAAGDGGQRSVGRPQPILDRQAVLTYRTRARELAAALAPEGTVPGRADDMRRELEAIHRLLRASMGRHGTPRDFPTDQERARTAVRKALVRTIRSISASYPELGRHLDGAIVTGSVCRYRTDAAWVVEVAR